MDGSCGVAFTYAAASADQGSSVKALEDARGSAKALPSSRFEHLYD